MTIRRLVDLLGILPEALDNYLLWTDEKGKIMGYPDYDRQQFMNTVSAVDSILDNNVADHYKKQPLAQDWARIAKAIEEAGEAVSAFIGLTGQNPRKGISDTTQHFYEEMADGALTFIYGLQHFTKDNQKTWKILSERADLHYRRLS